MENSSWYNSSCRRIAWCKWGHWARCKPFALSRLQLVVVRTGSSPEVIVLSEIGELPSLEVDLDQWISIGQSHFQSEQEESHLGQAGWPKYQWIWNNAQIQALCNGVALAVKRFTQTRNINFPKHELRILKEVGFGYFILIKYFFSWNCSRTRIWTSSTEFRSINRTSLSLRGCCVAEEVWRYVQ